MTRQGKLPFGLAWAAIAFISASAQAQQVDCEYSYAIQTSVNGVAGNSYCSSNSEQFIDYVKDLPRTNPSYSQTSAANIIGRFNDVNIIMDYAANSTVLTISMPELGVYGQTFSGATRDETEDNFVDWIKKEGIIGDIMNYQAKHSPTSPISGMGGLIPTMADTDFANAVNELSNIATPSGDNNSNTDNQSSGANPNIDNVFGVGINYGSLSVDGSADRVETFTLPLSYGYNFDHKPGHKLIFSLPISMYKIGDAKGYHVGFGLGYRFPITQNWSLTPSVRYALTGSLDRATVASVYNIGLTSVYQIPFEHFDLNIGNMIGYYKTGKFSAGDYSFNPDIQQTMLRNGIMLSQPITLYGNKMAIEYSLIDTRYIGGDKPFIDNTQQFGVTLGFHRDANAGRLSDFRIGASYINGAKGSDGFSFNFGYWF